jgi:hypothetical protein
VEGEGENAGGAEADEEGEEEARGEEVGPAPARTATSWTARTTGAAARNGGDSGGGGTLVSKMPRVRSSSCTVEVPRVRALREAAHRHDDESRCAGGK